jgi:hypothetical protein
LGYILYDNGPNPPPKIPSVGKKNISFRLHREFDIPGELSIVFSLSLTILASRTTTTIVWAGAQLLRNQMHGEREYRNYCIESL